MRTFFSIHRDLKSHSIALVIGMLLSCATSVVVALTPLISSRLIDDVLASTDYSHLLSTICIFLGLCLAQPILDYARTFVIVRASEAMVQELRNNIFQHYLYAHSEDALQGVNLITLVSNDVRLYNDFLIRCICNFPKDLVLFVLVLIGMFLQSPFIASLVTLLLIMYSVLNHYCSKTYENLSALTLKNYDNLSNTAHMCKSSRLGFKIYGLHQYLFQSFLDIAQQSRKLNIKVLTKNSLLQSISNSIMIASIALIYAVGAIFVYQGSMSVGQVIALSLFFQLTSVPYQSLSRCMREYRMAKPAVNRISFVLSVKSSPICNEQKVEDDKLFIDLNHVSVKFTDQIITYHFCFQGNGIHLIKGVSGAGKSTLFNVLCNLYPISDGTITIGVQNISRSEIAYELQTPQFLYGMTLLENLSCGRILKKSELNNLNELIKEFQLEQYISNLPNGLSTAMDDSFTPSGGEIKRLALIRALMSGRRIILLDEITSGLDTVNVAKVKHCLMKYAQSNMILIATHDSVFDDIATSIYTLDAQD